MGFLANIPPREACRGVRFSGPGGMDRARVRTRGTLRAGLLSKFFERGIVVIMRSHAK